MRDWIKYSTRVTKLLFVINVFSVALAAYSGNWNAFLAWLCAALMIVTVGFLEGALHFDKESIGILKTALDQMEDLLHKQTVGAKILLKLNRDLEEKLRETR